MVNSGEREVQAGEYVESNEATEVLKFVLDALPPIQHWSSSTIERLKAAISEKDRTAEWQEEGKWTRRVINVILARNEGWDWQRLKACSNADYFSLPTHTIALLNAIFYANNHDTVNARCEAGDFSSALDLYPGMGTSVGYPIFRIDYSSDERFELYKTCWNQFMEIEFHMLEAVDRDDVMWYWVDDKTKLDGKGPCEVRKLFHSLCGTSALPYHLNHLWLCLMVDQKAIESMLRVYGPPVTEIFTLIPSQRRKDIPFLPYVSAVDTRYNGDFNEPNAVYQGHFECALQSIFSLWQNEQLITPDEYCPTDGGIWGDIGIVFEVPVSLH
ncbi:hypothetical protein BP6252_11887 [Coleophoma cylindrospora]|uniref:Uncharacterized protein n=1 Tax=Coleophoma cylindrospora TaxID=1849047 RepID=A0A3D8QLW4_9HELO|nr:hypothetical protein BP6252_11887 [Coleophoma cylindrospora]